MLLIAAIRQSNFWSLLVVKSPNGEHHFAVVLLEWYSSLSPSVLVCVLGDFWIFHWLHSCNGSFMIREMFGGGVAAHWNPRHLTAVLNKKIGQVQHIRKRDKAGNQNRKSQIIKHLISVNRSEFRSEENSSLMRFIEIVKKGTRNERLKLKKFSFLIILYEVEFCSVNVVDVYLIFQP